MLDDHDSPGILAHCCAENTFTQECVEKGALAGVLLSADHDAQPLTGPLRERRRVTSSTADRRCAGLAKNRGVLQQPLQESHNGGSFIKKGLTDRGACLMGRHAGASAGLWKRGHLSLSHQSRRPSRELELVRVRAVGLVELLEKPMTKAAFSSLVFESPTLVVGLVCVDICILLTWQQLNPDESISPGIDLLRFQLLWGARANWRRLRQPAGSAGNCPRVGHCPRAGHLAGPLPARPVYQLPCGILVQGAEGEAATVVDFRVGDLAAIHHQIPQAPADPQELRGLGDVDHPVGDEFEVTGQVVLARW